MSWYRIFPQILNMSLTASFVILFVILARFLMRKMPKKYSYVLWIVVLFRLLCPVSISSDVSLIGIFNVPSVSGENGISSVAYVPSNLVHMENPEVNLPMPELEEYINNRLPKGSEQLVADPLEVPVSFGTYIWMIGMAVMAGYSIFSYCKLKYRLVGAVWVRDNIYMADHISSPFVMGVFRPRIYLLSSLNEKEQEYIILHEQQHIRRLDHMVKWLAYAALCIHWFNPLVWIAFALSVKDMEMSCDEAVVRKMGESIRADYSASLLSFSTGQRMVFAAPLAFGEGDTKGRIRNLAKWKKPAVWVSAIAVVLCVGIIWVSVVNPNGEKTQAEAPFGYNDRVEERAEKDNTEEATIVQTFNKTEVTDVYDEWIQKTYHKMSDGTWQVELEDENETVETLSYKYRIVVHGRMPNAAVESNYILLSNLPDITFKQTWMASGFSSNLDDYFTWEEAVFVSSWLGDLETNHPKRDENTIYVIETDRLEKDENTTNITESEYDWGISLVVLKVTSTGLTVACTQSGGNPSGELQTGSYYVVERETADGWVSVDYILETADWTGEAWMIPMGETVKWEVDWEWLYGKLPAGNYRIGKEIMDFRGAGDFDTAIVYAEFEIEAE